METINKVAFITRSTLYKTPGGDTVQIVQTAKQLGELGIDCEIILSNETIDYKRYQLLHFFNITRPADILYHCEKSQKPFVVSTILVDYSEYDKHHRKGLAALFNFLPADGIEYIKTMARWLLGRDSLTSLSYGWKGQRKSIMQILSGASMILPNSESEYRRLNQFYPTKANYKVVTNGLNPSLFRYNPAVKKDPLLVICVARIEGIKNQLNLIKALNDSDFHLLIIGISSPNQAAYYRECRRIASQNISFIGQLTQSQLVNYYQRAKVHVLPSFFETTGLSSIEAAAMGCSIVITDKGDTREYFGNDAFYCDPADAESIRNAVEKASTAKLNENLQHQILKNYTWEQAAIQTLKAYKLAATA